MPEESQVKIQPHPFRKARGESPAREGHRAAGGGGIEYVELDCTTNFTFLTGASHPDEMVERAAELGHAAAAIADTNTLAGIVRAHVAAKEAQIPLVVGAKLRLVEPEGQSLLVFPTDRAAYGRLCRLLTVGKRRAEKGECELTLHDVIDFQEGLLAVVCRGAGDRDQESGGRGQASVLDEAFLEVVPGLRRVFDDDRLSVAARRGYGPDDELRLRQVADFCAYAGVPMVATNGALYHEPSRRALQDVVTCIREGCTIEEAGLRLRANAERHLKAPEEMARLFAEYPQAIRRTVQIARRAVFSLEELRYEYPDEATPAGMTADQYLRQLCEEGAQRRYAGLPPRKTREALDRELAMIADLGYAPYFLTAREIVTFARSRGILCQGRGAAANSAVCYCTGVTEVDPASMDLLFERFVSRERDEPPDIDIDFEHERREEVIQHIYQRYGRDRAALTAEVISYRGRSAVREVGKAMGLSLDAVDALAKNLEHWSSGADAASTRAAGFDVRDPTIRRVLALTNELVGFPRHLSQHVGGFVITRSPLHELVPIENAAMADRTVIEWDKDDIDAMGMLKVDCLGLGMLTCVRKALELVIQRECDEEDDPQMTQMRHRFLPHSICVPSVSSVDHEQHPCGVTTETRPEDIATGSSIPRPEASNGSSRGWSEAARRARATPPEQAPLAAQAEGLFEAQFESSRASADPDFEQPFKLRVQAAPPPGGSRAVPLRGGAALHTRRLPFEPSGLQHDDTRQSASMSPICAPSVSSVDHDSSPLALYRRIAATLDDPVVYDAICKADTIGVFQIESRAQMSMLPRLRPRCFYDLVIEVAIVRPGPIQGKMVHPYLRRRRGEEPVPEFPPEVAAILGKTLGVPLFQEQAMELSIVAGGFTPGEADQLRRAMASWKRKGDQIVRFGERLIEGMRARGYSEEFAQRCFEQIKGFSEYGFPQSHSASFAILVYVSAWLKVYEPAAFAAALINSQPMGFYAPAQIVRDAQEHGVEVRQVDVNASGWDCSLEEGKDGEGRRKGTEAQRHKGGERSDDGRSSEGEVGLPFQGSDDGITLHPGRCPGLWLGGAVGAACDQLQRAAPSPAPSPALRLGMRLTKGLGEAEGRAIEAAMRARGPFKSVEALWRASGVSVKALRALAQADAFGSMGLDRQAALWQVRRLRDEPLPLFDTAPRADVADRDEGASALPRQAPWRQVSFDYSATGLSLKAHPMSFVRAQLEQEGVTPAAELQDPERWPTGRRIAVAGVVLLRQRPGTASGVVFMTLEDETGVANLIVRPKIFDRFRKAARVSIAVIARGKIERDGEVVHVLADRLESADDLTPELTWRARNFH
jgi:error-prone DNA polymerase